MDTTGGTLLVPKLAIAVAAQGTIGSAIHGALLQFLPYLVAIGAVLLVEALAYARLWIASKRSTLERSMQQQSTAKPSTKPPPVALLLLLCTSLIGCQSGGSVRIPPDLWGAVHTCADAFIRVGVKRSEPASGGEATTTPPLTYWAPSPPVSFPSFEWARFAPLPWPSRVPLETRWSSPPPTTTVRYLIHPEAL